MAFSNVQSVQLGGGVRLLIGNFTQSAGGGSQTIALGSGRAVVLAFDPKVTAEPVDCNAELTSDSISGGINTLTIYGNSPVTAGVFVILVASGS